MPKHQNFFATNLTSNVNAGDTTTPLNSIPSIDCPFWLVFDRTNLNGHAETVYVTSKTATNVNHAALTYAHTTAEEVAQTIVAEEVDGMYTDGMPYGMARQAIMNGNFDVWQRGISVSITDATIIYQADRWLDYVNKDGGTLPTLTRSRQIHTSGDIANSFYFTRLATNGAGTSLGVNSWGVMENRIENGTRNLCGDGKQVTVSFWARSSIANKRICPTLWQNYGTGGSPTTVEKILGTPITLTSSWTKYTATFTTNTLVGKTFGTAGDDYLQLTINYVWGTTKGNTDVQAGVTAETFVGSGNIDIAQVQLCSGDVALPFQPKSYEEELRACQRYYETNNAERASLIAGNVTSGSTYYGAVSYKVTKRIATNPTITNIDRISFPLTAPTLNTNGITGFSAYINANATGVGMVQVGYTVDCEL